MFFSLDQGSGSQLLLKLIVFSIVRSYPAELSAAEFMVRISTSCLYGLQDILSYEKKRDVILCVLVWEWIRQQLIIQELGRSSETCLQVWRIKSLAFVALQSSGPYEAFGGGHCFWLVCLALFLPYMMYSLCFPYQTIISLLRIMPFSIWLKKLYYLLFHVFFNTYLPFCLLLCAFPAFTCQVSSD